MKKYHVKKGDKVEVISGKWNGKDAEVVKILKKNDRAVLKMADEALKAGRKTPNKKFEKDQSGLLERSFSVHVSNVKLKSKGTEA